MAVRPTYQELERHADRLARENARLAPAADELKELQERYETAQRLARLGFWTWDMASGEVVWSDGVYPIFGLDPKEFTPQIDRMVRCFHPDDQYLADEIVHQLRKRHKPFAFEVRIILPDKSCRYTISTSEGHYDDAGALVGASGTIQDVTDRKLAERAVYKSEARYRQLVENLTEVILHTDAQGVISYISPVIESVIGYRASELVGRPFLDFVANDDRPVVNQGLRQVLGGGPHSAEIRMTHRAGHEVWVRTSANPILEADHYMGAHGVLTDISQRKRAEAEKRALEAQLRQTQKMEAIGTLAGGIAHDFNNILASVIGYAELALDEVVGTPAANDIQEVIKAGSRARELTKQILAFSRQADQERQPVQVKQALTEALGLLRASLPTTVRIESSLASDSLVHADATQVHQIVMNLCTNASHAMDTAGGKLMVNLTDVVIDEGGPSQMPDLVPGEYVKISIGDTGHGIAPELLPRIFEPFFTTKREDRGTGMGLAVVDGIVKTHRGGITVNSQVGRGSTFHVFLPVHHRHPDAEIAVTTPVPTGNEQILLVDDEEPVAAIEQKILKALGYRVAMRTDPTEAFELFRHEPEAFDLLLTDMTMPGLTGAQLARKMMAIRPDFPVILATGFSASIDEAGALALGIRAFIMKPILKRDLAVTIRRVLDGQAHREDRGSSPQERGLRHPA